jgi:hypothetical protein
MADSTPSTPPAQPGQGGAPQAQPPGGGTSKIAIRQLLQEKAKAAIAGGAGGAPAPAAAAPAPGAAPAAPRAEAGSVREAFEQLKGAIDQRLYVRQTLLGSFRNLSSAVVAALRQFSVFGVEEWEGGLSFDIAEFSFVVQFSEFDEGRRWPVMLFLQHEEAGFWKPIESASEIFFTMDAPDKVVYAGKPYAHEDFIRQVLFPIFQRAVETYTITEADETTGWDDEELWPEG